VGCTSLARRSLSLLCDTFPGVIKPGRIATRTVHGLFARNALFREIGMHSELAWSRPEDLPCAHAIAMAHLIGWEGRLACSSAVTPLIQMNALTSMAGSDRQLAVRLTAVRVCHQEHLPA
jgi:hypothetical protein